MPTWWWRDSCDTTMFTLSHTYKLNDTAQSAPETSATVAWRAATTVSSRCRSGKGQYAADLTALNPANQYRLHIVMSAGKEYRSDFVPFKTSPPIDSVSWVKTGDGGLQIYANTHDPQSKSTYYLWKYEETWEFHSVYNSQYEYLPVQDTIVVRPLDTFYYCWTGENSTNVLLGSSARLASDLIYEAPLLQIPADSWHISVEYSILVKQYVLTADAYNFWLNLQLNTEQIGSIFSPQPSQFKGNIHSLSDTTEQVLGYISAGSLTKQRIFINPTDIPNWTTMDYPNSCMETNIIGTQDTESYWLHTGYYIPTDLDPNAPNFFPPYRYEISSKPCVDCTQLGVNHKPSFWQ